MSVVYVCFVFIFFFDVILFWDNCFCVSIVLYVWIVLILLLDLFFLVWLSGDFFFFRCRDGIEFKLG